MTDATPEAARLLLPEGTRLLHVGPHKTGTTSLQAALWSARPAMLAQGVRHVGTSRHPATAARAVTGRTAPTSKAPPSIRHWNALVAEVRRAKEPRVILSSEVLAWATPDVIERIAADLDRDRVHVAITLRPLARILPSQWQQNVQAGARVRYETWLRTLFEAGTGGASADFWWLHRHDELVARWAEVVGAGRVTAVAVDERDPAVLLRAFAGLLGLREGTLAPGGGLANRSMTHEEIEAVRAFNGAARAAGIDNAIHASMMRYGAAIHMKLRPPDADERRIETPPWALDRARQADEAIVAALVSSGVRVVGDMASLATPTAGRSEAVAVSGRALAPPRVAAEMAMGIALASGLARRAAGGSFTGAAGVAGLDDASSWQLSFVVARRCVAAGAARAGGLRRVSRFVRRRRRAAAPRPRTPVSASPTAGPTPVPGAGPGCHAAGAGAAHAGPAGEPGAGPASGVGPAGEPGAGLPGALPAGTRILHIGPPKTGTTSVQAAFWGARLAVPAQGVVYPGKVRHSAHAVWAVTDRPSFDEGKAVPPIRHWTDLLDEIRDAGDARVVLSSEGFSYAADAAIDRVVADLDPARTHIVVTMRPVARLLASEWQEHAQSGMALPYGAWLDRLFHEPARPTTASFWRRQRHDHLIERWATRVGRDNVTAIVVDERDHDALLRTFEALCGLRPGTLEHDRSTANRSLTLAEITAIRALRERWAAEGLSATSFHRVIRMQVATAMKRRAPEPGEARIETPQWALDSALAIADEVIAGVAASGVRVLGDLEALRDAPPGLDGTTLPEVRIPPAISAALAMGVLEASGVARRPGGAWLEPVEAARISTSGLARVILGRAVSAVTRR